MFSLSIFVRKAASFAFGLILFAAKMLFRSDCNVEAVLMNIDLFDYTILLALDLAASSSFVV